MIEGTFWRGRKVAVTGAGGFIGSHVVDKLLEHGADPIAILRDPAKDGFLRPVKGRIEVRQAELLDVGQASRAIAGAQVVINCAARVAGIEYNIKHPGSIFRENMQVFLSVIEACRLEGVERFVIVSSACVYPRFCTIPTPEEEGFKDSPEPTNEGYGWSKRMEEYLGRAYAKEFGMCVAMARPYNAYGPRDNFDPSSSHVLPALIRRVVEGEDPLVVWGSGNQTRAFLYSEDLAEGILQVGEKYATADPVNLGTEREVSVRAMVETILRFTGRNPQVRYDTTKPEGQPRRGCDTRKMKERLHWEPPTGFEEGLRTTIEWYLSHKDEARV
jgi:GDP-L-fucose synthase